MYEGCPAATFIPMTIVVAAERLVGQGEGAKHTLATMRGFHNPGAESL
jgi:hypothetical protein